MSKEQESPYMEEGGQDDGSKKHKAFTETWCIKRVDSWLQVCLHKDRTMQTYSFCQIYTLDSLFKISVTVEMGACPKASFPLPQLSLAGCGNSIFMCIFVLAPHKKKCDVTNCVSLAWFSSIRAAVILCDRYAPVGIYSTRATNSACVAVSPHRSNISVIINKRQKNDQWLIHRAHIEIDFTKCF